MPETSLVPPLRVFLSYSHRDEELCERFLIHLSQLKREGLIAPWSDRLIAAGTDWTGAIDENLNSAHVIILLVSPDFLASDYCNDVEMDRAMEREQRAEQRERKHHRVAKTATVQYFHGYSRSRQRVSP